MRKKLLIFMLIALIVSTLFVGCSNASENKEDTQIEEEDTETTVAEDTDEDTEVSADEAAEAPTVTLFYSTNRTETEFSDEVKEEILNLTGVNIEYVRAPTDQWKQKLTLALSSGEIYDIMQMDTTTYFEYASEGIFYDITNEIDNYTDLSNYISEDVEARLSVDGKLYCVPNMNVSGKYNLYLRGDWLDNLGLEEPETIDEFVEVMRAFTEDDPDGNGEDDTYGYGNSNFQPIYGAYGVFPTYYTELDGQISTNSISENYKQALMLLNEMYEAGYIDPEVFIMESEQYMQKFANSEVGALTDWWSCIGSWLSDYAFLDTNPEGEILAATLPTGPDGFSGVQGRDAVSYAVTIHNESENKEAALTLLDFYASDYGYRVAKYGVEGINFSLEDGEIDYLYYYYDQVDLLGRENSYNEAFTILQRMDLYKEQIVGEDAVSQGYYTGFVMAAETNSLISNMFVGLTSEDYVNKMADVESFETEMRIKFILGEISFDDWETAYVEQWKELGGEAIRQSLLEAYNEKYGTSYTFLED